MGIVRINHRNKHFFLQDRLFKVLEYDKEREYVKIDIIYGHLWLPYRDVIFARGA